MKNLRQKIGLRLQDCVKVVCRGAVTPFLYHENVSHDTAKLGPALLSAAIHHIHDTHVRISQDQ